MKRIAALAALLWLSLPGLSVADETALPPDDALESQGAVFTVEQRFFTDWYPFHLAHVGGAVFFDAGRTWGGDASQLGLLRDVGLGLRLSSSRSGLGNVIHFDLAFPLDGDPSIKSMQWLVTTKASF